MGYTGKGSSWQKYDDPSIKLLPEGVVSYEMSMDVMDQNYLAKFITSVGSIVTAQVPMEAVLDQVPPGNHGGLLQVLFKHGLVYGTVLPVPPKIKKLETFGYPTLEVVTEGATIFSAFIGGEKNGETIASQNHVVSVPVQAPVSYTTFEESYSQMFLTESYYREAIQCNTKYGVVRAHAFRHESIPVGEEFVSVFMMALQEFPVLRAIPTYNVLWREMS